MGSLSGRSILELRRVKTIRETETRTERTKRISIRMCENVPLTFCAYSVEAKASTVTGNE